MKTLLRILTIVCYCLPFTFFVKTCIGPDLKLAYNKSEVEVNKQEAISYEKNKHIQDSIAALSVNDSMQASFTQAPATDSLKQDTETKNTPTLRNSGKQSTLKSGLNNIFWSVYSVWEKIKMPTNTSLSGIGTIFNYKNIYGKILIGISLLLSLLLLISPKFIRQDKRRQRFLLANILSLVIFLIISLLSSVSLLWGFWLLLILLFTQLYQEVIKSHEIK